MNISSPTRDARAASSMLCPVCHTALNMSERQGVEIDYCPQCRGVWLDRGELDKIIERSAQMDAPPPAERGYRDASPVSHSTSHRSHHEGEYRRKRKKSFLEELFD